MKENPEAGAGAEAEAVGAVGGCTGATEGPVAMKPNADDGAAAVSETGAEDMKVKAEDDDSLADGSLGRTPSATPAVSKLATDGGT